VWVHLRDVETFDDVGDVTAPGPVEPGDVLATADELYVIEAIIEPTAGDLCIAALARSVARFTP
jgi:hypothetical protein